MMNKILVPTDFSEVSENAINYAIKLANSFSATLVLLHVNQIPVSNPEFGIIAYDIHTMKEESMKSLKELSEQIKKQYPLISEIQYYSEIGNPSDVILELTKNKNIDLLVMGNNGHGSKFKKTLIGSTSVSVSKEIEIPLIIVPPNVKYKKIKNLAYACAYDEDIEKTTSLIKVRNLNKIFDSVLSVLHIIPENHLLNEEESYVDNYVETKLATTDHRTYIITENKISEGIINFIDNHKIDMIIVEPKKHSLFYSLFHSSVTNDLAFLSPVPVLTIHS